MRPTRTCPSSRSSSRWAATTSSSSRRASWSAARGSPTPSEGFVVDFSSEPPLVTDGPYGETKELFSGFWILEVSSKEEAAEWAKRCPLGPGSKLEVRRVNDLEDFPQDNEWIQKEAGWRAEAEAEAK